MFNMTCNIDKTDRINRTVLGALLLIGVIFNFGQWFFGLFGIIMIAEGLIGWCGIPLLTARIKSILGMK